MIVKVFICGPFPSRPITADNDSEEWASTDDANTFELNQQRGDVLLEHASSSETKRVDVVTMSWNNCDQLGPCFMDDHFCVRTYET